ncbi:MAG: hypothetical protein KTV68_02760 [Acidimicrobiia bacterium]|nr:hypothetical protein [Acidimicrobiia bacterium]MCY4433113.1 hypothetical protein [bacterium]
MALLALLALVASVLIWAAPSSQAQGNQAPYIDAGDDATANPGAGVTLSGAGTVDVDGTVASYEWEVETGPYDWIQIGEDDTTARDDTATATAFFEVPSEAFVDKLEDSDPQKYEIVVRLTVTDDDGATDSETVSININQRPVADIQVYAGLRDKDIVDGDLGARGHFPDSAVIDGPGENGNRDNEWDIMEGAYLQLSGAGSTDENPRTGRPSAYQWTRVRPTAALVGYAPSQTAASANPSLTVSVDNEQTGADSNVEVINFGDLDGDGTENEAADTTASPPQIAETISVAKLPDVEPDAPQTVFYQLTVCDGAADGGAAVTGDITDAANCTNGRTGATLIRIVVHDTSATPEVSIGAGLTTASKSRGSAAPQSTVSQFTGVDNQFIVDAGSTVLLTAMVTDDDQPTGTLHNFRWSGATGIPATNTATVRVPADADDGDTIDGSVTVTDATRISVTTTFQLLVGENTAPTAGGVDANQGSINNPDPSSDSFGDAVIWVHSVTDGFQSQKNGSTVTLRGVGNDADGDSIITAWALREGPMHDAFNTAIGTWLDAAKGDAAAKGAADGAALGVIGAQLLDMQTPDEPLLELNGALTDTVSFDVPNLEEDAGTILLFSVIDSNGVASVQLVYIYISADDDPPDAKAGADDQVEPGAFVRLNGSASSDPDVGDKITYKWEYTGATMVPLPNDRSPLSADEIDELNGWILEKDPTAPGGFTYIVNAKGNLIDGVTTKEGTPQNAGGNLKSTTSTYPWFDAPDLTGFNDIKLTFRLHVKDMPGTDLDDDGATTTTDVSSLSEVTLDRDLNGDGDKTDTAVETVKEADLGLDLNNDGDAEDTVDLSTDAADEANVAAVDSDDVTITIVNRFFSGNVPGPDHCTGLSLGGPQTYPFDSDEDGVADTCSLNTTRRATVARQNALETLANLNPAEFRTAVLAVCDGAGFKQRNYGDDPADLDDDVCETERVTPPPVEVDPADAGVFYSGTITGPDYCTNRSLGGARTYAYDSPDDSDGVADVCSLSTTTREAIARQNGLNSFIVSFSGADELAGLKRLVELSDGITDGSVASGSDEETEYGTLYNTHVDSEVDGRTTALTATEQAAAETSIEGLEDVQSRANRYSNAVDAACRALGTQDFGDDASDLARDACAPRSGPTGTPLS